MLVKTLLGLSVVLWSLVCLAQATPPENPAGIAEWLAGNPEWSILIFVAVSMVLTRLLDAGLKEKIPKMALPWVSMGVGILGQVSVALVAGSDWKSAIVFGLVAGGAGAGGYSAGVKLLPGMKASGRPKKESGSVRAVLLCFLAAGGLAVVFFAAQGCAWQKAAKITLRGHEAGLATADKTGLDYYQRKCRATAKKCPAGSDDKTCPQLGECWTKRRLLQAVLDRVALAVAAGWTSCAAADEDTWRARLVVIQDGFKDLSKELAGIIPKGALP
jgi:hypothetical protein